MTSLEPIPQPKPEPLIGNLREVDRDASNASLMRLARTYGPIYQLEVFGRRRILVSSQELVDELCDESRFDKRVHASLKSIRDMAGDGLFTADTDDVNWGKAHRLLMPAFGPLGIRGMFDQMLDIADQMFVRWERFGDSTVFDVADSMTRLTLDTIALCAFDYRFNSFYQNEMHPFVDAMVGALKEGGEQKRRLPGANRLMLRTRRKYEDDIRLMHEVADTLIAERRRDPHGATKKDLLGLMLQGRDPVTGEALSHENVRYQMVTFLVAGHETTSGLLSFATYLLLKNPGAMEKARAEVDATIGRDTPRLEHLPRMPYIEQVLMESLRLWPTAPAFGVYPREDTVIGGCYAIKSTDTLLILLSMLHRDPKVWGDDAEMFRPERFSRDAVAALPPNSWKPFGNGQRACIGRSFAMQEAELVLAMMLQRFDIVADDPSYELAVTQALTIKPKDFRIRVKRRGSTFRLNAFPPVQQRVLAQAARGQRADAHSAPLLVLYGSNTGSSEAFAQRLASDGSANGYAARVAPLDEHAGQLPTEGAVVIVTASYEGQPPDNARQFSAWLDTVKAGQLTGVKYAVFGCGNQQWFRTYQAVPKRLDEALAAAGATRVHPRGETDANADFFGGFDEWQGSLWPGLASTLGRQASVVATAPQLRVEVVRDGRSTILRQAELQHGTVSENRELVDMTHPAARSKRHVEIELPEGMSYRAGDYLAVLPRNPIVNVERALRRFGFAPDTRIVIHKTADGHTSLPTEHPVSAGEILSDYVELAQPAMRSQIVTLAESTRCPPEKAPLLALADPETYQREVLDRRASVLDLLERFASCDLEFGTFLEMLPPMRARQYSISSSPLWNESHCTLTYALVDGAALSGQGRYRGIASNYLASAEPGTRMSVAVRASHVHFQPPASPELPMVMVCAGTGLAPFRGFVQERAMQAAAGRQVGPSLLFFGCDHPDVDDLYRDEFDAWEAAGVVSVRRAFSEAPVDAVQFIQHRLWNDRKEVIALFRAGAHIYICGDGKRMAPAVRETFINIYRETTGASEQVAGSWADRMERETGRFVADVFA